MTPGSMAWRMRLDIANAFAQRVSRELDPRRVLETALGPLASEETRRPSRRAESKAQAIAFLQMAPEFRG